MQDKPNYYAIIPAIVRYDKDLKANEKLLYGEITALCNKSGFCWSGNKYFAELFGVTNQTVSSWISTLVDKGYLIREIIRNDKNEIVKRQLYLNTPIKKNLNTYKEKEGEGIKKNLKENITSINITSTNKDLIYSTEEKNDKSDKIPFTEIIDYLNTRLCSNYRASTSKTRTKITARWNEGFRLEDFFTVIDKKCVEWMGDKKMERYLRPSTLFGPKFEEYLNQLSVENDSNNDKTSQLKELYAEAKAKNQDDDFDVL